MLNRLTTNRWFHFLLLFSLLSGLLWFGISDTRLRADLRHLAFDNLNKLYPRDVSEEHKVVIVDIDDEALLNLGQWPWPRTTIATIVENLTDLGARVIAFDGVLAEPDRTSPSRLAENLSQQDLENIDGLQEQLKELPDHDDVLAKAIKKSKIFVSGFTFSSYVQTPAKPRLNKPILAKRDDKKAFLEYAPRFDVAATFLPELEKVSAGNGSFMASPDHDGILRRTGLIFSDGKRLYPSLSLEAVRVAELGRKGVVKIGKTPQDQLKEIDTSHRIVVGDYVIPVGENALAWVYYRYLDFDEDYVSAYKVFNSEKHDEIKSKIQDKVIFIGSSAEGLKDLRNTALQPFRPGVEIHANIAEQILSGQYLLRPALAFFLEALFVLMAGLLTIIIAPFINVVFLTVVCGGMVGSIFTAALYAYTDYGVLVDPVFPSLSILLLLAVSTLLTYIRVEAERRQVRTAFGMYVSPDVMKDLEKNPDKLKLGGELKELSVMFTDIRSFTTISEGLTPEDLIELMNEFLTEMSDIVLSHEGTIDKYMGDAMMAFWNAPPDVENHPRKACIAALKMQTALEPVNERVAKEAKRLGKEPVLLQAGIGINTGPCAVGNMGSKQRFAYSTLGDAVNLASRLESQTKNYGSNTLIGEDTYNHVQDMAVLEYDLIQVKGKTKPVRIFNLIGDDEFAKLPEFIDLKEKHQNMLDAYRGQNFKEVQSICNDLKSKMDRQFSKFYELYYDRATDMINDPPAKDWDGVFIATSK